MMTIRPETPEDVGRVRQVNELAFGGPLEANLVDRLPQTCADYVSLVAEAETVIAPIFFSPVVVESGNRRVDGMGLGPMAVLPARQQQGIGSQLVQRGLAILRFRVPVSGGMSNRRGALTRHGVGRIQTK